MRLRIAVDARPLSAPLTGIGRYTNEVLRRLATSEHEFFLYTCAPIQVAWAADQMQVRRARLGLPRIDSLFAQWAFGRWARKDAVDLFWSPRHHLPLLPSNIPSVVTIHDLVWKAHPETMTLLRRLLERALVPRSLRRATRVIADSYATASDLEHHFPAQSSKIDVVPLAPSCTAVEALRGALVRTPFMLFVGTLEPRKNLGRLIDAYLALRRNGTTSHRLVIAGGRGWKDASIHRRLTDPDVAPHIDLVGRIDDGALATLYSQCDFLVFPSLYEGVGLPILEAMAHGKPVITSNTSSMPEVAGNAAILVDPLAVDEIETAMARLIADRDLHNSLADAATRQVQPYCWDRTAQRTLEILEAAARGTRTIGRAGSPGRR